MTILGLDLGTKTIGVAKADNEIMIATGLTTLKRTYPGADMEMLTEIISSHNIDQIVMGLPLYMDGGLGEWGYKVKEFAGLLEEETGIEVVLWDERFSTVAAEKALLEANLSRKKRKKVINKQAAVLILQSYLDYRRKQDEQNI